MIFMRALRLLIILSGASDLGHLYEREQEEELHQERQSRLSFETAQVQELTQTKGNYLDNNFRKFYLLTLVLNIWLFMVYRRV